jgi:hydrogenase maturation protease
MSLLRPGLPKAPILILAVGNPSRGDDAVGPLLAECLQAWLTQQPAAVRARFELITDQQLVVEHVLDMQGREQVLFIDAAAQGEQAVSLVSLAAPAQPAESASASVSSHSSTPAQLLALHLLLLNCAPPAATLLSITGHGFELGASLSQQARSGLRQAWPQLMRWLSSQPIATG